MQKQSFHFFLFLSSFYYFIIIIIVIRVYFISAFKYRCMFLSLSRCVRILRFQPHHYHLPSQLYFNLVKSQTRKKTNEKKTKQPGSIVTSKELCMLLQQIVNAIFRTIYLHLISKKTKKTTNNIFNTRILKYRTIRTSAVLSKVYAPHQRCNTKRKYID